MFTRDPAFALARIEAFNAGRAPKLLALKYGNMSKSAFAFFRGSCHLFYEDWRDAWPQERGPAIFITGDLHLENFGAFKTLSRNFRYDINDFDEATIAYPVFDIARLVTSVQVASKDLGMDEETRESLGVVCLKTYLESLTSAARCGVERFLDEKSAEGPVAELLEARAKETRQDVLKARTELSDRGVRRLKRGDKLFEVPSGVFDQVASVLKLFEAEANARHSFSLLDVGFRIAGTGSLGVQRYAALVEGKGGTDGNLILDIKEAFPCSLLPFLPKDPARPALVCAHEAERVVRAQRVLQGDSPPYLGYLNLMGRWSIVRELQPSKDRLELKGEGKKASPSRMEVIAKTAARLTAWSHTRAIFEGAMVSSEEQIRFAELGSPERKGSWGDAILRGARLYTERVFADYAAFLQRPPPIPNP